MTMHHAASVLAPRLPLYRRPCCSTGQLCAGARPAARTATSIRRRWSTRRNPERHRTGGWVGAAYIQCIPMRTAHGACTHVHAGCSSWSWRGQHVACSSHCRPGVHMHRRQRLQSTGRLPVDAMHHTTLGAALSAVVQGSTRSPLPISAGPHPHPHPRAPHPPSPAHMRPPSSRTTLTPPATDVAIPPDPAPGLAPPTGVCHRRAALHQRDKPHLDRHV